MTKIYVKLSVMCSMISKYTGLSLSTEMLSCLLSLSCTTKNRSLRSITLNGHYCGESNKDMSTRVERLAVEERWFRMTGGNN